MLKLDAVLQDATMTKSIAKTRNLGGNFIQCDEDQQILFKVSETSDPAFWRNITTKFALNGTKAII